MSDNIHIKLPDGSDKEMPKGVTALDVGKSISPRLADTTRAAGRQCASHPIPRITTPAPAMSLGKNDNFRREILIDDAEGKLPEGVFSEVLEVGRPTMG